jgi:hypothetical protein
MPHVYPFALEDGGRLAHMVAKLVYRLAILVVVHRFHGMGVADSLSLRSDGYVCMQHFVRRSTSIPFWRLFWNVRRQFMQRLFGARHGTLGSSLCDVLQEGNADTLACLHRPRAGTLSRDDAFIILVRALAQPPRRLRIGPRPDGTNPHEQLASRMLLECRLSVSHPRAMQTSLHNRAPTPGYTSAETH